MNRNLRVCFLLMIFQVIADAQQYPILTITSSGVEHISAETDNISFFNSVLVQAQKEINADIEQGVMVSIPVENVSNYTQEFLDIKVVSILKDDDDPLVQKKHS